MKYTKVFIYIHAYEEIYAAIYRDSRPRYATVNEKGLKEYGFYYYPYEGMDSLNAFNRKLDWEHRHVMQHVLG